jgi:hypothetical protein
MYLRRTTKKKGGADYDCRLLAESVRTARGPRQRVFATPSKGLKVLLQRLKILVPNKPKIIENVVEKMA